MSRTMPSNVGRQQRPLPVIDLGRLLDANNLRRLTQARAAAHDEANEATAREPRPLQNSERGRYDLEDSREDVQRGTRDEERKPAPTKSEHELDTNKHQRDSAGSASARSLPSNMDPKIDSSERADRRGTAPKIQIDDAWHSDSSDSDVEDASVLEKTGTDGASVNGKGYETRSLSDSCINKEGPAKSVITGPNTVGTVTAPTFLPGLKVFDKEKLPMAESVLEADVTSGEADTYKSSQILESGSVEGPRKVSKVIQSNNSHLFNCDTKLAGRKRPMDDSPCKEKATKRQDDTTCSGKETDKEKSSYSSTSQAFECTSTAQELQCHGQSQEEPVALKKPMENSNDNREAGISNTTGAGPTVGVSSSTTSIIPPPTTATGSISLVSLFPRRVGPLGDPSGVFLRQYSRETHLRCIPLKSIQLKLGPYSLVAR